MEAVQPVVQNVQENLANQMNPEPVQFVNQQNVQQAAQQVVENVQANIQPEMVAPQAQEIVNQAVNQETFVNEVVSQATNEAVSEAVTFAESVTERAAPPIVENVVQNVVENVAQPVVENVVEPIAQNVAEPVVQNVVEPVVQNVVSQSPPIIETSSEAFETPVIEPQVTETVSEMVSETVTEVQTEVTTLLTSDEGPMISKLTTADYLQWAKDTHLVMTISISMAYLFIILLIRRLLSKRSPFHLRSLLFLWNLIRVVIHIAQTVILVRLLAPTIKQHSKHIPKLLCHETNEGLFGANMETIHFWIHLFTFVKLIELVDTLFVVLRKQQLTLSHTYYRITSLIYAFFIIGSKSVPSYYPIMVLIHVTYLSIMSFYYLVRSRSIIAPKWIRYTLNLISLIEATGLFGILGFSLYQNLYKEPCSSPMSTDIFGLFIVGTNTILFINYLRSAVIKPKTIKLL